MPENTEALPLSQELLGAMRNAAAHAIALGESFITPRALLLALLDDAGIGPAIGGIVSREKLLALKGPESAEEALTPDKREPSGEHAPLVRYDTLAFKTPEGRSSMWLCREALQIFMEGAQRADDRYLPKHLALGVAAEAVRAPGVLAALRIEPGTLIDAIYRL